MQKAYSPNNQNQDLRKKRISWYLYDWANSAYSTTVITLFLGPFLTTLAKSANETGMINFFGFIVPAGSIFPYSVSLSVILQAIFLPFIGSIADRIRFKNLFLALFVLVGAFATVLFFFINEQLVLFASLLLIISNVAFGASIVIYNSYLVEIANESEREEVSSKGWAIGYLGGGILLVINILILLNNDFIGISKDFAVRLNIAMAGVWWGLFSIPAILKFMPKFDSKKSYSPKKDENFIKQFINTLKDVKKHPTALLFLIAYLFYNDGVQSVISLSSQFGQEELKLSLTFLTIVILIVQFVAAFGSMLFFKISRKLGEKNSILLAIFIWIFLVFYAFAILKGAVDFLILAIIIAIVMGGTQSLSRSLYSKLIPKSKEAEYFSFYEISEKGSSWIGPLLFGLIYQLTLSYRLAILSLMFFFIIGGLILFFTKINLKINPR
ncbi:MAG: hypothetical protein A2X64_10760 [Ignavibacteria bacterium GWF2_33_9]|nr:MAG: hypothetical protein A2X64_10760 [Ignavibacteria bacterium GWF2_33_9]